MSFSLQFVARHKPHAKALLTERRHAMPASVYKFLEDAIDNMRPAREGESSLVQVKAVGHLCDGPSSYDVSNATIEVSRLAVEP